MARNVPAKASAWFSMNDKNFFDISLNGFDVTFEFIFVGVTGKRIERGDSRADLVRFAENIHDRFS